MLCGWLHPYASSALNLMDNLPPTKRLATRAVVLSIAGVVSFYWYTLIYCLPKLRYNEVRYKRVSGPLTLLQCNIVLTLLIPPASCTDLAFVLLYPTRIRSIPTQAGSQSPCSLCTETSCPH